MLHGIFLASLLAISCTLEYSIPEPKFHLLRPRGFRVSIPDESGIKLFAFHGNLNKDLEQMGNGQFSQDVTTKRNGKWIYENKKMKLRDGDTIHYWVFVIKNGEGFTYKNGTYICKMNNAMAKANNGEAGLKKLHAVHHLHHHQKRSPQWRFHGDPYQNDYNTRFYPGRPGSHRNFDASNRFKHRCQNHNHHHKHHGNYNSSDEDYSDEEDNSNTSEDISIPAVSPSNSPNRRINNPTTTSVKPTTRIFTTTTTSTTTEAPSTFPNIDIRFGAK